MEHVLERHDLTSVKLDLWSQNVVQSSVFLNDDSSCDVVDAEDVCVLGVDNLAWVVHGLGDGVEFDCPLKVNGVEDLSQVRAVQDPVGLVIQLNLGWVCLEPEDLAVDVVVEGLGLLRFNLALLLHLLG